MEAPSSRRIHRLYRQGLSSNFQNQDIIEENQAFTWNPSVTGAKSEDTILATSKGPEMITHPILYPTLSLKVEGVNFVRPAILEKEG